MDKQQISDPADKSELTHQKTKSLRGEVPYTDSHSQKNLSAYTTQIPQVQNNQPGQTTKSARAARRMPTKLKIAAGIMVCLLMASMAVLVVWYRSLPVDCVVYQMKNKQQVSQDIGGGGLVFPHQQFDLSYPATGRVMTVMVKAGDQVAASQPLLKLDPSQITRLPVLFLPPRAILIRSLVPVTRYRLLRPNKVCRWLKTDIVR
jgi:biotin carboxyl carrier protein